MCGEQPCQCGGNAELVGSPPRVRGTASRKMPVQNFKRITPACAGNRRHTPSNLPAMEDHPRVCGEQIFMFIRRWVYGGSPPRVRGTADMRGKVMVRKRITPACAGNSCPAPTRVWPQKDHPRVCGEQASVIFQRLQHKGSPPRVRGTVLCQVMQFLNRGITPACAGNSNRLSAVLFVE